MKKIYGWSDVFQCYLWKPKYEFRWCPQCGGYHWNIWTTDEKGELTLVFGCSLSKEEYEQLTAEAEAEEEENK